jgi:hypothetical protein
MAADKTTKRKNRGAAEKGGGAAGELLLRTKDDPRRERRFEPKASPLAVISMVAMSIGAVLVGAGTYAQWFRAENLGPLKQAPFLLGGGAALLIAVALFGQQLARPIRVGDAGVALEKDSTEIDRIEWRDVTRLILSHDALTVQGVGTSISVPLGVHRQAAARILAEVSARIPKRVEDLDGTPSLGAPDDTQGEVLSLEPPQVAGAHCKSSEKLIAFEKDARLCGRCGEVYHKDSVPTRCLTCDAPLKG